MVTSQMEAKSQKITTNESEFHEKNGFGKC